MDPRRRRRWLQRATVGAGVLPAAYLALRALLGDLGANPIEEITHTTGDWALRFLLLTLAVTPLRRLFGWSGLAPLRRTLGLTAFCYACLHFLTFVGLDHFFDWQLIAEDVLERRYVTVGFTALLCLTPLAVTSTDRMVRRLGRRWKALHRLVYAAAVAAVVHYFWLVKADRRAPLAYAAVLGALLGIRLWHRARAAGPGLRREPRRGSGLRPAAPRREASADRARSPAARDPSSGRSTSRA